MNKKYLIFFTQLVSCTLLMSSKFVFAVESNIRNINFEEFLSEGWREVCSVEYPSAKPVLVLKKHGVGYADLTGDGKEEAVVRGYTCYAGNGSPDILQVYTLSATGTPTLLYDAKKFDYASYGATNNGVASLDIINGKLVLTLPIFLKDDPRCCPTGGQRIFTYRFDGITFIVAKVKVFDDSIISHTENAGMGTAKPITAADTSVTSAPETVTSITACGKIQDQNRKIEKVYYPGGSLFSETNLFSGHSGFYRTFHKNGALMEEKCYDDVSIASEHTWEETSDRLWEENGKPLVREGLIKTYYADGTLNEETEYKNDKKNGRQRVYYYDGKTIVAERYFLENKRVGVHTAYDASGRLIQKEDWGYPTWYTEQLRATISSLQTEGVHKDLKIKYLYVTLSLFLFIGFVFICVTFLRKKSRENPLLP